LVLTPITATLLLMSLATDRHDALRLLPCSWSVLSCGDRQSADKPAFQFR
jgi:hypothetical protein